MIRGKAFTPDKAFYVQTNFCVAMITIDKAGIIRGIGHPYIGFKRLIEQEMTMIEFEAYAKTMGWSILEVERNYG